MKVSDGSFRLKQPALLLTICLCLLLGACLNRKPFDSEQWIRGDIKRRGQMVGDLRERRLLEGKSKAEVFVLLGKPDYQSFGAWVYRVDIGHKFGHKPWLYDLWVVFHPEGGVVERVALTD